MNNPLVSVIVPVYNADKYLSKCIESILNQTFKNFELLLVNDASTDDSASICNHFESLDNRIEVFLQKENQGDGVARNIGIENAKGKYILFIDADDEVLENHIQSFFYTENIPSGTLVHAPVILNENGISLNKLDSTPYKIEKIKDGVIVNYDFLFAGPPWSKLFETEIIKIHHIRFNSRVKISSDFVFYLEYLLHIHSYVNVGVKTLIYYIRSGSLSGKYFSYEDNIEKARIMLPLARKVIEHFGITDENIINKFYSTPILCVIFSIHSLYRFPHKKNRKERYLILENTINEFGNAINKHWISNGVIEVILKILLKKKLIFFIDSFLSISFFIKLNSAKLIISKKH